MELKWEFGARRGSLGKSFCLSFSHFLQMSLKHSACHTFRASGHLRWGSFRDSFLTPGTCFFEVRGRVKQLAKYGRREQNA